METKTIKTIKIFLSSSNELRNDRFAFADFIMRLQQHYVKRNYQFSLDIWESIDSSSNNKRKQDEYYEVIRECDIFVFLLNSRIGDYTLMEFDVALEECRKRGLPFFVYFKNTPSHYNINESKELIYIKNRLVNEYKHFWGTYDNNDKLHLDFALWLDSYLFDGKSEFKTENGMVTIGSVKVADMSQLSFAVNNKEYQQREERLRQLDEEIDFIQKHIIKYPDNSEFATMLSHKITERDIIQQEFDRQQDTLLAAAKNISELRKQQVSKKLQEALEAFEAGQLDEANILLENLKSEGERLLEDIETKHEQIHEHIDALWFQATTVMSETEKPINERITRVSEIYEKADDWANRSAYDKEKYAHFLFDYATFLDHYGLYNKAEQIYLRQIELSNTLYGIDSIDTAKSYNNIGKVYYNQGHFEKALEYYFKALSIREKVLGTDHPDAATSYNNIGLVYLNQGDYDKALEYFFKALDINEKVLGNEHPSTAASYNNIGSIYDSQGDYDKALEYFFKALDINEKVLGNDHPSTAASYNNIGLIYDSQGKHDKALEYFFKALDINEKVLGNEHPSTAASYNNIGSIYDSQGKYDKALEYFFKALVIVRQVLGETHPSTASCYSEIGSIYDSQGDYAKALEYFFKALEINEKEFGTEHPSTATSYNNIGSIYDSQGEYDKALEYFFKALAIKEKVLGTNHPDTATSYDNIGRVYYSIGDYDTALKYWEKTFEIFQKTLGASHPITSIIEKNINTVKSAIESDSNTNTDKSTNLKQNTRATDIKPISTLENEDGIISAYKPSEIETSTSFIPDDKAIILLNKIINCAKSVGEEEKGSFQNAMSSLAEELRKLFKSEYCSIGTIINDLPEDSVVSIEKMIDEKASLPNKDISLDSKANGNLTNFQLALKSPNDISYFSEIDNDKIDIYIKYQRLLKSGKVENTTVIPIRKNYQNCGYIQFINSNEPINNDMILSLKGAFLGLIQIIINEKELRKGIKHNRDEAFINSLQNKTENVNELLDSIMDYFSKEFNAAVITFRIPLLNGINNEPLYYLRRVFVHPFIDEFKRKIIINHFYSERLFKYKNEMLVIERLKSNAQETVLESFSKTSLLQFGIDLSDNSLIVPIFCNSEQKYGIFRLRFFNSKLSNSIVSILDENKDRLAYISKQLTILFDSILNKQENESLNIFQNELKNRTFVKIKEFDKQCAEIIKESVQANVCSIYRYDSRTQRLTLSTTTAEIIHLNDKKIDVLVNHDLDKFFINVNEPNNVLSNVFKAKQTYYVFDINDSTVHKSAFIEKLDIEQDRMNKSALAIPMINKDGICMGLVLLIGKNNSKQSISTSYWMHDINQTEFIVNILTRISESDTERLTFLSQLSHELLAPVTEQVYDNDLTLTIAKRNPNSFSKQQLLLKLRENIDRNMLFKYIINDTEFIYSSSASGRSIDYNIVKQDKPQEILLDVIRLMEKEANYKGLTIKTYITSMPSLYFDKERMMQVFLNLLKNAIRYADRNTVISVSYNRRDDGFNEICFANFGIGVQKREKESIFELFHRGEAAKRRLTRGTGLGLYIVRDIMRAHGGDCYVRHLRNPTEFVISLPNKE